MIVNLNFHNADGRIVAKGHKYEIKDCRNDQALKDELVATMVNSYYQNALNDIAYTVDLGSTQEEARKEVAERYEKHIGGYFVVENKKQVKISVMDIHNEVRQLLDRCCKDGPLLFLDAHVSEKEADGLVKTFKETQCKACGSLPKAVTEL